MLVHLAGESVDVVVTPQALGIQGRKKRITKRRIDPGVGIGERKDIAYTAFTYDFADPGFAEHDLDEYDHASAELAWSRTLDVMRKAFRKDTDLERPWEINTESKLFAAFFPDSQINNIKANSLVTICPIPCQPTPRTKIPQSLLGQHWPVVSAPKHYVDSTKTISYRLSPHQCNYVYYLVR